MLLLILPREEASNSTKLRPVKVRLRSVEVLLRLNFFQAYQYNDSPILHYASALIPYSHAPHLSLHEHDEQCSLVLNSNAEFAYDKISRVSLSSHARTAISQT